MRYFIYKLLLVVFIFVPLASEASVKMASGFHTSTTGRTIPLLYAGVDGGNWSVSALGVGVATELYYYSTYQLSWYSLFPKKSFAWGALETGLGVGAIFSDMGSIVASGATIDKNSEITIGPSIRILWLFAGPIFIGFETVFGFLNPILSLATMTSQDASAFLLGMSF